MARVYRATIGEPRTECGSVERKGPAATVFRDAVPIGELAVHWLRVDVYWGTGHDRVQVGEVESAAQENGRYAILETRPNMPRRRVGLVTNWPLPCDPDKAPAWQDCWHIYQGSAEYEDVPVKVGQVERGVNALVAGGAALLLLLNPDQRELFG